MKRKAQKRVSGPRRTVQRSGGSSRVIRRGLHQAWSMDLFHRLLRASWKKTLLIVIIFLAISNLGFTAIYFYGEYVFGKIIENSEQYSFADAFFFSVQTMATIGYGQLHPIGVFANTVATLEAFYGLTILAMSSGILFVKLSRPTANVLFSEVAVVTERNGQPALMFRLANARSNQIIEGSLTLSLLRNEVTAEGERIRLIHDMKLLRSRTPIFSLSWTVVHFIDKDSPLYGQDLQAMRDGEYELLVTFTGIDDQFSQTVHARYSYLPDEVLWNRRFVDIFSRGEDNELTLDYSKFHLTQ